MAQSKITREKALRVQRDAEAALKRQKDMNFIDTQIAKKQAIKKTDNYHHDLEASSNWGKKGAFAKSSAAEISRAKKEQVNVFQA